MKIHVLIFLIIFFNQIATAQSANPYDVIIDEIMADPTPEVGLPDAEWIELKNVSSLNINLSGWRIGKGVTQSGTFSNFILRPDSFVIVCTGSALTAMSAFGTTVSVTNFPALNNEEDLIYVRSNEGKIIHAVNYKLAWYGNELKKAGGWTLEMIDTRTPCGGYKNWKAAVDITGGTPGKINSTDAIKPDDTPPELLRVFATDSVTLSLVFDEPLDSLAAANPANYTISEGIGSPLTATPASPLFNKVNLRLSSRLLEGKDYTVTINTITDCSGNIINSHNTAKAGLSSVADSFDIVINEILFNPGSNGTDYVEIYNRSANIIDLKQLYIATRNTTGVISSIRQLSSESVSFFPGDFIVLTEEPVIVQQKYLATNPDAILQLSGMPSFSNDKGDVIILNARGKIVDEVAYFDNWHFELITNTEGVSIERIDYSAPSVRANFHSAATSVGYGTPGYKNSQFRIDQQLKGEVIITPEVFSPDNDGNDDFATINYNFTTAGYVANITIFDASGRPVRYLERNALCGVAGFFRWNGLGEKQQKLSQGIYIVYMTVFNTSGKKQEFKKTIVLARR